MAKDKGALGRSLDDLFLSKKEIKETAQSNAEASEKKEIVAATDTVVSPEPAATPVTRALHTKTVAPQPPARAPSEKLDGQLLHLPVEQLQPGRYQPRHEMSPESLQELANSIKTQGIIQPIVARQVSPNKFEIIAGERRWRAAQLANLTEVPAVVRDIPDEDAIVMALIENIQREELNPMEESRALQRLIDEFNMTHQQVADAVGKSRTAVTNYLRLSGLTESVRVLVERGDLEMGHARALLTLSPHQQIKAAHTVVDKGLSVRETERLVKDIQSPKPKVMPQTTGADPHIASLQTRLSETLAAKVAFDHTPKGRGKIIIHYNSLDELDGILEHIKK